MANEEDSYGPCSSFNSSSSFRTTPIIIDKEQLLHDRKECIGYNVALNYSKSPLVLLRGQGQYLYDENDHEYLDCVNNVAHVGHAHPYIAAQLSRQVALLYTNSRYLHPYLTMYSKRLLQTFPSPLSVMFWVNSGSEANDLALRLAREHTKRRGIITVEGAYHGHLTSIIDISPYKYNRDGGQGKRGYIREAPAPDVYSGKYRGRLDDTTVTDQYVNDVRKLIDELRKDEEIETSIRLQHHLVYGGNGNRGSLSSTTTPTKILTDTRSNEPTLHTKGEEYDNLSILSTHSSSSPNMVESVVDTLPYPRSSTSSVVTVVNENSYHHPQQQQQPNNHNTKNESSPLSSSASTSFYDDASSSSFVYPRSNSTSLGSQTEVFPSSSSSLDSSSRQLSSSLNRSSTVTYTPVQQEYIRTHLSDDGLHAGCGAFIMESILSCGGQIMPPKHYLKQVYQAVREAGGVCIADEVQTGFGRVGSHFWAFQLQEDIVPDIVTIGKPMGNGFPVAAVVTTPEIARSFANTGIEYFNTFGGNPLACTAALATLDVIDKEELQSNALRVGEILVQGFNRLMEKYNNLCTKESTTKPRPFMIGSVRGTGLMVGMEFITDNVNRTPDGKTAIFIKYEALRKYRILLSTDGMHDQVIKLKPPMCFTPANALTVVEALDNILMDIVEKGGI